MGNVEALTLGNYDFTVFDVGGQADLLVFANKQDMKGALSREKVTAELGLEGFPRRTWLVQPVCASTGDGLLEGFEWLATTIGSMTKNDQWHCLQVQAC